MGDMVFPTMVADLLPVGLRGLVVGSLLSALMSSLSSLFNSCATLFTKDIYEKMRPEASEKQLVRVGRIATVVVVGFGLLWIPVMKQVAENNAGIYDYLQNVQGFLAPPILAVFLLGLFYRRVNTRGALWGLGLGFVLGMGKLTIQTTADSGGLTEGTLLHAFGVFNGYYFTGLLFVISLLVIIAASYTSPPEPTEQIRGLTYDTISPEERAENRTSGGRPAVIGSVIVIGLVLAIYLYFSFWLK
jgi:SSS family solute:Na+ symporter